MKNIWAPWRYEYLSPSPRKRKGCIFCQADRTREDRKRLVLLREARSIVLLNLYPYTNGHLMIAPRIHASSPEEVDDATRAEIMEVLVRTQRALRMEYRPDGWNVGLNLGRAAGAGIADHFHLHVVPRWAGDTNFMTVAAETRVLSESLDATWRKLRRRLRSGTGRSERRPR